MGLNDIITLSISVLTALTVGGIIGSIIGLRFRSKVEKAKADQETARADQEDATTDKININNASELINLYKQALLDVNEQKTEVERSYLKKIAEYEKKLTEYDVKLSSYQNDAVRRDDAIDKLTKALLKAEVEINGLKASLSANCNSCTFREACQKRKAIHESFNDKGVLSNK